jgi:Type I phosphodiesterase / nucleotide pyrophosphatase
MHAKGTVMGYARHIGRVGALAVTLGVGIAIATPGIGYADTTGTASGDTSTSSSTSTGTGSTNSPSSTGTGATGTDTKDDDAGSDPDPSVDTADDPQDADTVGAEDEVQESIDDVDEESGETPPPDEDIPVEDATPGGDVEESELVSEKDDSNQPLVSSPPERARGVTVPDASDDVDTSLDVKEPQGTISQNTNTDEEPSTAVRLFSVAAPANDPVTSSISLVTAVEPAPQPTLVTVVAQLVSAVLNPLMSWGSGIPFVGPVLLAALGAVRNEMERILFPQTTKVVAQQTDSLVVDPTKQRVLLIGVDGANLSRILADAENENFLKLIEDSTNSAPSIVGHTTISNPSWTAILTGVWGERTGVINNVFTPWTYNSFPTVFNQLESLETPDQEIVTKAIANWNVINAIAGAGSDPVDTNVFIGQVEGDTNWLATDDLVGDETVDAIRGVDGPTPNFLFSYFVGVDENGHLYGGASEQYAEAIRNVDDNLGEIMAEVEIWNAAHPDEQWTIMVVTDHGHQPQQGFGHGFQSPDETETFVIAYGSAFKDGNINLEYEIVDTTPTVVSLFGGPPRPGSDGVPLTSLAGSDVDPGDFDALLVALKDQIASNRSPDPLTDLALSLRTIFATIPYLVYEEFGSVPILGDLLYVVTNIPAQIVAYLTGVQGASIFPLLPPEPPSFPSEGDDLTSVQCGPVAESCVAV